MIEILLYSSAMLMVVLVGITVYFKDFYERLICVNMFGNIGVVLIVALGSYQYNSSFVDIAIIYLLLSYVVNMAVLRAHVV